MPTQYSRRHVPCTGCGDVVVIAERRMGRMLGARMHDKPRITLEHADPGPDGEVFDAVDDGCRRPRVVPSSGGGRR